NSKSMAKAAIYGAIVNVVFSVILVRFIGIQGAAIATMFASFVIYFIRHKELDFILKNKSYKCNIISWVLIALQSIVVIYTNWYIVQVVIIFVMIITFNKQIKILFEKAINIFKNKKRLN
ncbi:MAG: polysaccharide biosynthesis protein, partial [Clostridia bacterium]|nr:polysaccharide biosynthesis protein [Clostridia bacterium]